MTPQPSMLTTKTLLHGESGFSNISKNAEYYDC